MIHAIVRGDDWADELSRLHGKSPARTRFQRFVSAVLLVVVIVLIVVLIL